jgi:predicted small metal-binding protein
MPYSIQCRDAGMGCPASFTVESKEELLKHIELHAKESHPDLELEQEKVEQLIKVTT